MDHTFPAIGPFQRRTEVGMLTINDATTADTIGVSQMGNAILRSFYFVTNASLDLARSITMFISYEGVQQVADLAFNRPDLILPHNNLVDLTVGWPALPIQGNIEHTLDIAMPPTRGMPGYRIVNASGVTVAVHWGATWDLRPQGAP